MPFTRGGKLLLVLAMVAFGFAVYLGLGLFKGSSERRATTPTSEKPLAPLPGTLFLAQEGSLYRLSGSTFTQLGLPPGTWSQPALLPGTSQLVAVLRDAQSSDLYLIRTDGTVVKQLTRDASGSIDRNRWAFYPRPSADGQTLYYSFDRPKEGYRVDLNIWSMPLPGTQAQAQQRSFANDYSGGDTYPVPLSGGGLVYAKYGVDNNSIVSQLWLQLRRGSTGQALTKPEDDCGQPALSPDVTKLAMICTHGAQTGALLVADFDGTELAARRVLVASGQSASPSWSPDGSQIAFLSPADTQGRFQLWTVDLTGKVTRVTSNLDFDATSAPAWSK
jgi:Tol biopolymer transport system component